MNGFEDAFASAYAPRLRRSVVDPETGTPVVTSAPPTRGRLPSLGSVVNGVLSGSGEAGRDLVDGTLGSIVRTDARMNGQMPMHDEFGRLSLDTIGDLFGAAGTAMTGSMPFAAPKGALRSFGGAAKAGGDDALASLEAALGSVQPATGPARSLVDPASKTWDLYHGTPGGPDFQRFDPFHGRQHSESGALFLAPNPGMAEFYAGNGAAAGVPGVEAGPRMFRVSVDPGRTGVFDLPAMIEANPDFHARAGRVAAKEFEDRGLLAETAGRDAKRDAYREQLLGQRAGDRDVNAQLAAMGLEPSATTGVTSGHGYIGAAIDMAREQGLDTAIIRGLAEHNGGDQVIALTPGRVRSHYAPDQLLYGGAGLAAGAAGAFSAPGEAEAGPIDAFAAAYRARR